MAKRTEIKFMTGTNPTRAAVLGTLNPETKRYAEGVFVVSTWSFQNLTTKINAVNRKLAKYGKPPVEPISWKQKIYKKTTTEVLENGTKVQIPAGNFPYLETLVYIEAAKIQLSDRKHIEGTISRVGDSNDMVVKPYGAQDDDEAALDTLISAVGRDIHCDHCGSNRTRNSAWILRNEDGSLFMVGESCAKDYFGMNVASMLNDLIDLDETSGGFSHSTFDRVEHVALTIGTILKHGFVSLTTSYKLNEERRAAGLGEVKSTCDFVGEYMDAKRAHENGAKSDTYDVAKALEAIELVKANLENATTAIEAIALSKPTSNFEANTQAVIRSMAYAKDWWGNEALIVAGIASYLKAAGFELPSVWAFKEAAKTPEQRQEALGFTPGFVGAKDQRLSFAATVETVRPYGGDFPGYLLVLRTATNQKVLSFGNGLVFDPTTKQNMDRADLTVGTKLNVTGTVKEHKVETYKGVSSDATIINRPVIILA